jgi:hypothetical protein
MTITTRDSIRYNYILLCFINLFAYGLSIAYGQKISNSVLFKKQSLSELTKNSPRPQEQQYQNITTVPVTINNYNPILGNGSIEQQNRKMQEQHGMWPGQQNKQNEEREFRREQREAANALRMEKRRPFLNSLQELLKMNPDSFSVTQAIYLSESACYAKGLPTYQQFEDEIKRRAELVKQILKKEGIDPQSNVAKNYGIQKLYKQDNSTIDSKTKKVKITPKLSYDFNDFLGDKNWDNMLVKKLLLTNKGQCHSMPLLYLAIAEKLDAKVYLSLSPQHSFVQYFDENGYRYNFETTNGNLVNQTWLMQSGYINATALKNKTYLDTLSSRQLYAQLLSDLLQSYIHKIGYDEFSEQLARQILFFNPNNLVAIMTQANYYHLLLGMS